MDKHIVMGVNITNRVKHVPHLQSVLTEFGCLIKTRLGLHDASKTACSANGLVVLELIDDPRVDAFSRKLSSIEGVEVQQMVFGRS